MMLSKHVPLKRAIHSDTAILRGINNMPHNAQVFENMKYLSEQVIEPVMEHFHLDHRHISTMINSFYRSPELNTAVGGSATSQHCKGQAVDLDFDDIKGISNRDLYIFIAKNLNFDQMIWEFGDHEDPDWVHVSLKKRANNRRQLLRAQKINGRTNYTAWSPQEKEWEESHVEEVDKAFQASLKKKLRPNDDRKEGWLSPRMKRLLDATNEDFTL